MRIRVRELRNVLQRLIAEGDMLYSDIDDTDDFGDSPVEDIAEPDQDAVQDAIRRAFQSGLSVEDVIDVVSTNFPSVPIEMIEDMADIESEVEYSEPVSGPASFRPSLVQARAPSIVSRGGGYN